MKKFRTPIAAFLFFLISAAFIANYRSLHFFMPAQQVELSHGVEYGAVLKDFLFIQEITTQKRFIGRIDLYMARLPSRYTNENVFLLLDDNHRVLFTKRFSSADFGEALYFPFDPGKDFDIGKGKKIFACIYSVDGDQGSYIGLAKKADSHLGRLYVVPIVNNDVVRSFEMQQNLVNFTGSIGVRTYESDTRFFSLMQVVFYILALLMALGILFTGRIASFIGRIRIIPEQVFLGFSLAFGAAMLVITPPFMVPDEPAHFYRAYQVSELNIFKIRDNIPKSLTTLASICDRMKYSTHEKTTRREILSLAGIRLDAGNRTFSETQNYTIPYIPQAFGILAGRILHLNPLWLMYLGRMFNLLVSVLLLYLAIKTTPVLKWTFFLLGIMPMTLYQFASLSYDSLTISLSLLLTALILRLALEETKKTGRRQLILLFLLSGLLAASKPPYFIIALSFLIIPVARIGSRRKFALTFTILIVMVLAISQAWAPGRRIAGKMAVRAYPSNMSQAYPAEESIIPDRYSIHNPLGGLMPLLPHTSAGEPGPRGGPDTINPVNPAAQRHYILEDPLRYIGTILETLPKSAGLYIVSFTGLFGWVDSPLPGYLCYFYLLVLLLVSFGLPNPGIKIGILRKLMLFAVFTAGFLLIETAMYLYCNPVGSSTIIAVQGRYFIAFAPLMFVLFARSTGSGSSSRQPFPSKTKSIRQKQGQKQASSPAKAEKILDTKTLPWVAMLAALVILVYSLYVIFERFYVILL